MKIPASDTSSMCFSVALAPEALRTCFITLTQEVQEPELPQPNYVFSILESDGIPEIDVQKRSTHELTMEKVHRITRICIERHDCDCSDGFSYAAEPIVCAFMLDSV